ncbi:MAG: YdbH domain-containing protein, partial [Proteobacteria bacterium]|nr:YdbH domain-containing protein [Pseudomonadota bacterium]
LGDYALEAVSIGLILVAALALGGYAGRRALVGELAEAYLRDRGVEAEIEVVDVDARGFVGRVRLGPSGDPDFAADRVEVLLAAPPPPEGPYALRPQTIRVVGPRIKARWTGDRLSLGSLDPLVDEALSRPRRDDRPSPRVIMENGRLRLLTPYGLLAVSGSGVVDDSRLERLDLALSPAALEGESFLVDSAGGTLRFRSNGQAVDLDLKLAVAELQTADAALTSARLSLSGRTPYPDLEAKRLDGPVALALGLSADYAAAGHATLAGPELNLTARGAVAGPFAGMAYTGDLVAAGRGARLEAGATDVGEVRLAAHLSRASLTLVDAALSGRGVLRARLGAGTLSAGGLQAVAPAVSVDSPTVTFAISGAGGSASGPVRATGAADRLSAGDVSARALRVSATSSAATFRDGRLSGPVRVALNASEASGPGGRARGLEAQASTALSVLTRAEPIRGTARAAGVRLAAEAAPFSLTDARLRFDGRAGPDLLALNAALQGGVALPAAPARRFAASLPILGDSPAYVAALTRALGGLELDAPGLRLAEGALALTAPVQLRGRDGARAELAPAGRLTFGGAGPTGGFRLAVGGGGLPDISAQVDGLTLQDGDLTAHGRLRAALDIPLAQGAAIEARGRFTTRDGAFAFSAANCVRLRAARIELGENDVEGLSARICPKPGAPIIQAGANGYRIRGRFEEAAVLVPFLQARLTAGSGALDASGAAGGLTTVATRIAAAEVADTAPERRFHPVALTGTAALGQGTWRAALQILDAPAGTRLARADLIHLAEAGRGGVDITADELRFTPDGLQPHDLSPLAAGVVSDVEGAVDFTGRIAWAEGELPTSEGRLTTAGLSLDGPLGRVVNLGPALNFSSLTPLIAPPGQVVTAERIDAFTPITDVRAEVGLESEALTLQSASLGVAGGQLRVEPLRIPFAEDRTLSGAVRLDDVDLGALIEETGFADKVELTAVVDGRIPFVSGPGGLRFDGGELRSVRPGRLSIAREALTQVAATGPPDAVAGAEGAPAVTAEPNAFQDFAYQALENLAYNDLEVSVDSRPGGRLGMVFTVKGRHDPPVEQRARIGLFDLLRGRAFQRRIPLPSDTPVNLTLDTSLNFDELLQTWLDLQRERSAPVQSAPTTTNP